MTIHIDRVGKSEYTSEFIRPLTQRGYLVFHQIFSEFTWNFLTDTAMEMNEKFDLFHKRVLMVFNDAFPEKPRSVRSCDNGLYWYNNNLRKMRESYLLIQELYIKYQTAELLRMRNSYRSAYREAIDSAKRLACNNFIDNSSNKAMAMWKLIRGINGERVDQTENIDVDVINDFFVGVAERMVTCVPVVPDVGRLPGPSFAFRSVSPALVRGIVNGMKNSNAKDTYHLSTKFIKRNVSLFVEPLTKLLNLVLETSVFPDSLKTARVMPIHKKGDINDYRNYRPISILPAFSKIFERALYDQIVEHVEAGNLLYKNQFGFRRGRNTSDAVTTFVNLCMEGFEMGEYCVTLFLDLTRAFDCVSHRILLHKLMAIYNFCGNSIKLIESYLTDRTQYVTCGRRASGSLPIRRGVPQGSILGPLLFLLFFNDFPNFIEDGIDCLLYADDATIIVSGLNRDVVEDRCSIVMEKIREWCLANELCLNESKSVKMLFTLRTSNFINPEATKFLGVYISAPNLRFDEHARHIGAVISRNVFLLRKLKGTMSLDVAKTAYHALVQSHINYAILAWGNSPASKYVFKLQRRAVRVLGGLEYREDCRDTFISLAIMTLPSVYILELILYAHANRRDFLACADVHSHDTRNKHNIYLQRCRLSLTQRAPASMSQTIFNKLPTNLRVLPVNELKAVIKTHLLRNAFYSIEEFLNCNFIV